MPFWSSPLAPPSSTIGQLFCWALARPDEGVDHAGAADDEARLRAAE